ncbi:MAG TPA: ATP-binding protein [Thermoanaerobaculia bacterium]|nr:ATP-binding protein [Thermoanaerobaculia bacterium]
MSPSACAKREIARCSRSRIRASAFRRAQLTTIFEPYNTLRRTGTAGEPSIGLGLAIVKQLAELHRAVVEVESEEGRGSLFRVAFPLVG